MHNPNRDDLILIARYSAPLIFCLTFSAIGNADAVAQPYPTRAIRLITPSAPGGGVDFMARLVGSKLSDSWGQPVIIDNRAGAGNALGTEIAARAAPDGYTLTIGNNSSHGVNPVFQKLPYDTIKDFTPITLIAGAPMLLVANNSVPAKSLKEFVDLARAKPGQLNLGSAGNGTLTHLAGELFKLGTATHMTHIPYKGVGPAFTAMLAGDIHLLFASTTGSLVHVQSGRIKALAITGVKRSQLVPDIPTLTEQGVAGFEAGAWYALLGPAAMPRPIVMRLNQEVVKIVNSSDFKQKVSGAGAEPVGSSPEECAEIIRNELAKWTKLSKEANIRLN